MNTADLPAPPANTAYLAPPDFVAELRAELGDVTAEYARLLVAPGAARPAAWAANVWHAPERLTFGSIGEAAKLLRARQPLWALYPYRCHRRAELIRGKLPPLRARPHVFPRPAPTAPLGPWTLLDEHTLLAAARCSSPFATGEVAFDEDQLNPPNRAYLKLWEFFTLAGRHPAPGERCVDLGACPGGWTWVLLELGARVVAVDKAPLDPRLATRPGVEWRQQSAFALDPRELGPIDWLCADIACYPPRLLALIERFRAAGTVRHFVCTVKFQGATDHATARAFAAIPGSRLQHLHHNRHELTWSLLES